MSAPLLMVSGAAKIDRCVTGHRDARHFKDGDGWICSACGTRRASFGPTWGYYGCLECRTCGRAAIDWVACSPACRQQLDSAAGATDG